MWKIISSVLAVLLIGSLGGLVWTLSMYMSQNQAHAQEVASLRAEIDLQRRDKNRIRDLWEAQTAANDKLVIAQENVRLQIAAYQAEFKKSIRFLNTGPELLPGISEKRIKDTEAQLQLELENLEAKTQENAQLKQESKETIDAMYLQSGEDQSNRVNPDGLR